MAENLPDTNVGNIEYIRKDVALDALKAQVDTMYKWVDRYAEQRRGILTAVNIIEDIKPADVVSVVRCKDCRNCSYDSLFDHYWCNHTLGTRRVKPDDFCSYGKRREE